MSIYIKKIRKNNHVGFDGESAHMSLHNKGDSIEHVRESPNFTNLLWGDNQSRSCDGGLKM